MRPDRGRGGDYSSIDLDGMAELVRQVRAAGEVLQDEGRALQREAGELGISTRALAEIVEIGAWAEEQVEGLRRRLTLAQAMQISTGSGLPSVVIGEPVVMTSAQAAARGRALARTLRAHSSGDAVMAEGIHEVLGELAGYGTDPEVLSAFFAELGRDVVALPAQLVASGSLTQVEDLRVLSVGLGMAMRDPVPPRGFEELRESLTKQLGKEQVAAVWDRLALLQHGDFPAPFLATAVRASGLTAFAREGYDVDYRGGGAVGPRAGLSVDNVALMFSALGNNPQAARLAFEDLDLGKVTARVYDLPQRLGTGEEIAAAFGTAKEAATGASDETMGQHSKAATRFTLRFVQASGAVRDVSTSTQGSLGRIAASWAPELVTGSYLKDAAGRASSLVRPANFDTIPGLDPKLFLAPADVYRFVHGFASDDRYGAPFDDAVGELYHSSLVAAAREGGVHSDSASWEKTQGAFGNLAGFEYAAKKDVRAELDEADAALRHALGGVFKVGIGTVPSPQSAVARLGWRATRLVVRNKISTWAGASPDHTRVALLDEADRQAAFLCDYEKLDALVEAGYPGTDTVPVDLRNGDLLKPPEVIARDEHLIRAYQDWTDSTDHGHKSDIDNMLDSQEFKGGYFDSQGTAGQARAVWREQG